VPGPEGHWEVEEADRLGRPGGRIGVRLCDTPSMASNRWLDKIEQNPGHSEWYIERFRTMAADGVDLHGEARLIDAMVGRGARILDAGCGPGRVGGRLAELGHDVV